MRWGAPEPAELGSYELLQINGITIYVHGAVKGIAHARIDVVTGGVGTKLILLGCSGHK